MDHRGRNNMCVRTLPSLIVSIQVIKVYGESDFATYSALCYKDCFITCSVRLN